MQKLGIEHYMDLCFSVCSQIKHSETIFDIRIENARGNMLLATMLIQKTER